MFLRFRKEIKKRNRQLLYACLSFRNKNSKTDEKILVKFFMLLSRLQCNFVNIYRSQKCPEKKIAEKLVTHCRFGIRCLCLADCEIVKQGVSEGLRIYACISKCCFLDISFNFLSPEFWAHKYNYL
jgi:hypothetical protein